MNWLATAEGLGSEVRWVVDHLLGELAGLKDAIWEVECRLCRVTKDDPVVAQLMTLAGIGLVTALVLRAEIGLIVGLAGPEGEEVVILEESVETAEAETEEDA